MAQVILCKPMGWGAGDGDDDEVCFEGVCVGEAHDGERGGGEQREGGGGCVKC